MDITQTFYDQLATQYDKLFFDWQLTTREQAAILRSLFRANGYDKSARILDCACGIGTQAVGLALLGYSVTGSDISQAELAEAQKRARENNVKIRFERADFRALNEIFSERFDVILAMDNALPHMLTKCELKKAIESIADRMETGGLFVASIRDYDTLLETKPPYSPPYIHKTEKGQRVCFQTWDWKDETYRLVQYIIDDEDQTKISRFECEYRATKREELTELLLSRGFRDVVWKFPDQTGFYQPIVLART